ncbi:MAG TPA: PDZ domain-containing protein [Planctomycetota bacterium]|nr:PDZ domain-containing protein [Planctomycetota bacterium]
MRTVLLLLAFHALAVADDTELLVRKILASTDAADRARLVETLVAGNPDPRDVAKRFAAGREYASDVPTGRLERTIVGPDGKERDYLLFVPEGYVPGKRYPLLFDLHGGVSRTPAPDHEALAEGDGVGAYVEREGFLLAIPAGEKGAEWWTDVGMGNVLGVLAETSRLYNVDENRVFATGFSDGGSGSFYLALAAPTLFAGVVPLNGHIGVAQAGGLQVHLGNLVNVPVYAVNTTEDQLYPSASLRPAIDAMKELGVPITWHEIKGYGHDPSYVPEEMPAIAAWLKERRRDPHPKTLLWEGAAPGRVRWLAVTEIGERKGDEFPDVNPKLPPGRVRIGINIDQAFEGPGVLVAEVQDGYPGKAMGLEQGDILVAFDGTDIGDITVLLALLKAKSFGDTFKLKIQRGAEILEKEGKFPDAHAEEVFRRGRPFGTIRALAGNNEVDVRANGVKAFELYLGEPLFDLNKPVVVRVNGKTMHEGVVAPDLRFLVGQAAADKDRTMVYLGRIRLTVGP